VRVTRRGRSRGHGGEHGAPSGLHRAGERHPAAPPAPVRFRALRCSTLHSKFNLEKGAW